MARLKAAPSLEFFSRALVGIPRLVVDETANENSKTFIVPNNVQWLIQSIYVVYIAANTGGDRQLEIDILDLEGDVVGMIRAGKEQAVNTTRKYMFAPGLTRLTAFYDTDYLTVPLMDDFVLLEACSIRIFDNNNVSATDDFQIQMLVREMDTVDPSAFGEVGAVRDFGDTIPSEDLTITPTAPTIGVFPVFIPGAEDLTITPVAPLLWFRMEPSSFDFIISTTAPTAAVA